MNPYKKLVETLLNVYDVNENRYRLGALENDNFFVDGDVLVFSLAELKRWVFAEDDTEDGVEDMDEKSFLDLLYGRTLNADLKSRGWIIETYQSTGNIHSSLYQLRPWLAEEKAADE